ncbi:UDP-2,4-diacetamido-2,4,6-trideoxy-beta-L-altropyranose hydrolase [Gracilibacillus xinjiangensis]|uniref:UDP-2,4-diacetamido-2,4, 6-trideoxy-beta-L-altropyranose hydrolase n=1 Tax=Gracilibacillus xinjiangensis TaxID=1193282 RepID=A0ABV8WVM1_9BACI
MQIIFRTDASTHIGTGHVMRCLVLAESLKELGAEVAFICRKLPGNLTSKISANNFPVYLVEEDHHASETLTIIQSFTKVDCMIVDHYDIDLDWEEKVKPFAGKLMVIDDLANRPHDCDILLDQNHVANKEKRYDHLIPKEAVRLFGVKYLLLRKEFREVKVDAKHSQRIKRILISFGGSDPTNETMKALQAVASFPYLKIDVMIGEANPYSGEILSFCHDKKFVAIHQQTKDVAILMAEADIAIGAGGTTTWERIYMLLPSLTIETAANQADILAHLADEGLVYHLGKSDHVTANHIKEKLLLLIKHPDFLLTMRKKAEAFRQQIDPLAVARLIMEGGS